MLTNKIKKIVVFFMQTNKFFYKDLIFFILDIYKCPVLLLVPLYGKNWSKKPNYSIMLLKYFIKVKNVLTITFFE